MLTGADVTVMMVVIVVRRLCFETIRWGRRRRRSGRLGGTGAKAQRVQLNWCELSFALVAPRDRRQCDGVATRHFARRVRTLAALMLETGGGREERRFGVALLRWRFGSVWMVRAELLRESAGQKHFRNPNYTCPLTSDWQHCDSSDSRTSSDCC